MSQEIKVMSCNLRYRTEKDGANCFDYRLPKLLEMIRKEAPDVIGFQEATDEMRKALADGLTDYVLLGHGREKNYTGEGTPIAYKKERFVLHALRQEWLSITPSVPATKLRCLDQSGCPRMYCCVELADCESGELFAFYNVHLDHMGKKAQSAETMMLYQRIAEDNLPYALTGDFNAYPESDTVRMILSTEDSLGTVDATSEIKGTLHCFLMDRINSGEMSKIDYIFTNMPTDPARSYAVADDDSCGCFYSDHLAVCAFVNSKKSESKSE